jgi:hypothetical protein
MIHWGKPKIPLLIIMVFRMRMTILAYPQRLDKPTKLLGKLGFSIFGWLRLFGQRSSSGTFAKTWARKVWDIRTSLKL